MNEWILVTQSRTTLRHPMDYSLPGSCLHKISQARILEWVAIPFSRGPSRPRDGTRVSCASSMGRWNLYHHATWEARLRAQHSTNYSTILYNRNQNLFILHNWNFLPFESNALLPSPLTPGSHCVTLCFSMSLTIILLRVFKKQNPTASVCRSQ